MKKYELKCLHPQCGKSYADSKFRLQCDEEIKGKHGPALLQALYRKKKIKVKTHLPGIFPFLDWLPVDSYYIDLQDHRLGKPLSYRSEGLGQRLGLKNLFIAFSGFWPEKGANLLTATFKEFECQANMVRYLMSYREKSLLPYIISSAGNTGNAYNLLCSLLKLPFYLIVPERGLSKLSLPFPTEPFVIAVKGDYSDAISLADKIAGKTGLMRDRGVRNSACRAGAGTVMLNAVTHPEQGSREIFDHYFQAIGSGTGAIAAWESVQLLLADGRFGNKITKIHVAQNAPFTPVVDAWEKRERNLLNVQDEAAKGKIFQVTADVLTTRNPAYSIAGGIFDVLTASKGSAWKVNNSQLFQAAQMFRETEGIDIDPAAAVAVDALRQAVISGKVRKDESILLHITGGGKEKQYSEGNIYQVQPKLIISPEELNLALERIGKPLPLSNPEKLLKILKE